MEGRSSLSMAKSIDKHFYENLRNNCVKLNFLEKALVTVKLPKRVCIWDYR